jgi:DNA-binding response OmpR family regulator
VTVTGPDRETPYVICVGTSPDEIAAVTRAVGGKAVIIAAQDALALRPLLDSGDSPPSTTRRGPLTIDRMLRRITWDGATIDVSPREFDLLSLLASDTGRVWTFQEITATVWKMPFLGDADMVLSAVKRLRRRVLVVTTELRILSVRGIGFRLTLLAAGETRCEHPLPRSEPA